MRLDRRTEEKLAVDTFSAKYLTELFHALSMFPHRQFERLISALLAAYDTQRTIFVMGNGGSAATASHWACDLNKGCFSHNRKRLRILCLNDNMPTILAYANDISYEDVFVEQLKNFFAPGDVVIGISGSGNSKNVLKAIEYANRNRGVTIGLCGFDGGKLYHMVHVPLLISIHDMQKVEDAHTIITHMTMQRLSHMVCLQNQIELVKSVRTAN